MTAIAARNVTVRYGEVVALDDVSVEIGTATVCGLIGMNGSGKSTLMKALLGIVRPDHGSVELLGQPQQAARKQRLVSYIPQAEDVDWDFPLRVYDVVMMGRYAHQGTLRHPRPADRDAVAAALDRVGLTDLAGRQIGELSGGQRKRAFVARCMAQDARLLLMDEPFAGIDRRSEADITALLRELRAEGRTVLIATHDLAGLPALCDEAILLQRKVIAHGTPDAVLNPETLGLAFGLEPQAAVRLR